jgi:hypothetical protein
LTSLGARPSVILFGLRSCVERCSQRSSPGPMCFPELSAILHVRAQRALLEPCPSKWARGVEERNIECKSTQTEKNP